MIRTPTALTTAASLAMLMAAGCTEDASQPGTDDVTASDVREQASEAADTAAQFTREQFETYANNMQEGIESLESDIQQLESRAQDLTGEAQSEAREAIDDLKAQRDQFAQRLQQARDNTDAAWDDIRSGLEQAWNDLDQARKSAMDRFGG